MTSPAAGTWRDRPAIKWLLGYALLAAIVNFSCGAWGLLPENHRLEQVQCEFNAQRPPPRDDRSGMALPSNTQRGELGRRLSAGVAAT